MPFYTVQVKLELWRSVEVEAADGAEAEQYARNAARRVPWDGAGHGSAYATVTRTDIGSVHAHEAQRVA